MTTVIRNATIIPMTEKGLLFHGDVSIRDGKIHRIGTVEEKGTEEIDGSGMIAMPSFVNCHTHAAMVLMRNFKDGKANLQDWLAEIFRIEDKLEDGDIYWASKIAAAEMIESGCTAAADMYFNGWNTIRAFKEAGIRGIIGMTFFGDGKETEQRLQTLPQRLDEEAAGSDLIRIDAAPHAIYTCTRETYEAAADWALGRGAMVHTHLSETRKEVEDSLRESGMTPLEYLDSFGFFRAPAYLAHCVHLTDSEIERLGEIRSASVVHNPASNLKLASGYAPVAKMRESGINVAIGTDGASSNNNLSMIKDIGLAALLAQPRLSAYDILSMATRDGAKALGLGSRIGTLEEGKDADLILVDTHQVNETPLNDPFSALAFSTDRKNIDTVFCKGRKLLEHGRLLTIDKEEAIAKANEQWEALLRR